MANVFEDAAYELHRSLMKDAPVREYTEEERNRVFHVEYPQDTFGSYLDKLHEIERRRL